MTGLLPETPFFGFASVYGLFDYASWLQPLFFAMMIVSLRMMQDSQTTQYSWTFVMDWWSGTDFWSPSRTIPFAAFLQASTLSTPALHTLRLMPTLRTRIS
jgi:hypothetical protein